MKKFKNILPWIYSILSYFFFGGMIFTMMTQFPNWDHNLPDSMVIRNQFYAKTDPVIFFQFFGPIINLLFLVMIISIWKLKKSKEFIFNSVFYFLNYRNWNWSTHLSYS